MEGRETFRMGYGGVEGSDINRGHRDIGIGRE
jgi:hypothetical protein